MDNPQETYVNRDPQRLHVECPLTQLIMVDLDPNWVVGFTDGEGTFYVGINRHDEMSSGFQVLPEFRIVQHKRDLQLLHKLKKFFDCGVVRINHDDRYELRIRSIGSLSKVVVPFFEKYSLQTKKKFDFLAFRRVIKLIEKNMHLNANGIKEIIKISCKMNRGEKLITKKHFYSGTKI